jgi:hypothetical protein
MFRRILLREQNRTADERHERKQQRHPETSHRDLNSKIVLPRNHENTKKTAVVCKLTAGH